MDFAPCDIYIDETQNFTLYTYLQAQASTNSTNSEILRLTDCEVSTSTNELEAHGRINLRHSTPLTLDVIVTPESVEPFLKIVKTPLEKK